MENNQEKDLEKDTDFMEDFKDFDEDDNFAPEIDEDLANEEENELQESVEIIEEQTEEIKENIQEQENQENNEEALKQNVQIEKMQPLPSPEVQDISPWEELDKNNSVVKKYIFYVSKDFVPYIDNLTTDERTAYINDAIQKKIDLEDENRQKEVKRKVVFHFVVMILTICFSAPFVLLGVHKAIMLTFDNYKYSQENFEKLYKSRFEKDRAYMRSIQYNKEQKAKKKK